MYIARQYNGDLYLFRNRPIEKLIHDHTWFTVEEQEEWEDGVILLNTDTFPEITYDNSPIKVKLIHD